MRAQLTLIAAALMIPASAQAGSQSSNTSSNSSSNNGVVRERVAETYCDGGYCERYVERRVYRDRSNDRRRIQGWRDRDRYYGSDRDYDRGERHRSFRYLHRDDDDD